MENQQPTSTLVNKENNIYSYLIYIIILSNTRLNVNELNKRLSYRRGTACQRRSGTLQWSLGQVDDYYLQLDNIDCTVLRYSPVKLRWPWNPGLGSFKVMEMTPFDRSHMAWLPFGDNHMISMFSCAEIISQHDRQTDRRTDRTIPITALSRVDER